MSFKELPYPDVIETIEYEAILNKNKLIFKEYLNEAEYELLESDRFAALLQAISYREVILRSRINSSVKSMLLRFATGRDLDNKAAEQDVYRLKGAKPTANIEFSLSSTRSTDTYLQKGLILRDDKDAVALLKEDVIIEANSLKAIGVIEFQEYTKQSNKKCEYIQTPLPFLLKAKQLTIFENGAEIEDDERLRERAFLSPKGLSTAGSEDSYIYHTLTSNVKVEEVKIENGGAGVVNIYIKTPLLDEDTRKDVENYINDKKRRTFTDYVHVINATEHQIQIKAELEIIDMFRENEIYQKIEAYNKRLGLGVDLNLSHIYSLLHCEGVYRVNLETPTLDTKVNSNEFISIFFDLSFKKALL
ncbi:baseplate assembly protein [Aliarcobacter skirrowii]|uniref:baseplate J/gp47 family protein n=1 Tax=Aliarcobacter skirrowii TaxID=28200 RepID=UPI00100A94D1|nr:baseplate J/gp47 family protein [Aliarcobacter skirrowii]RXJ80811.1 baseplate assembly protein [Aliarcobacter skirrowii]